MGDATDIASEGFGLTKKQRQLIIRVLWVLFVTTSIFWMLGAFAYIGFASPLAKAEDVKEARAEISSIKQQVAISTRLQLMQEIRVQKRVYCTTTDDQVRQSTLRYLDALVDDLRKVYPSSMENPIPVCPP